MTDERLTDEALITATDHLIDAQELVGEAIDSGTPPEPSEVDVVVRRAEDVQSLADEAAHENGQGSPSP